METIRVINLGIRFFLELAALATGAYWGATVHTGSAGRIASAVVVPAAIALLWGLFISPKARIPTGRLGRSGLGLVVFLAAAAMLADRGHVSLALAFAVLAAISSAILYVLPQFDHKP